MRIRNRLYPYPVLRSSIGDYLHSTFTCTIDSQVNDVECKILFNMACTDPVVLGLIESGRATYAVHIECKYTYYRTLRYSSEAIFSLSIDSNTVDRILEICPVIIATEDIIGYSNCDLDDVYEDETIIINSGNPIAIAEQATIEINKVKDILKKLSAPFCVLPYPETSAQPAQKYASIDYTDPNQLLIYLPKEDFAVLSRIQESKNIETIHSALYFPSLIEALDYMKSDAANEDREKRWYIALNNKAIEKGLGEIKDSQLSAYELAQILFDYPLTRWLKGYAKV